MFLSWTTPFIFGDSLNVFKALRCLIVKQKSKTWNEISRPVFSPNNSHIDLFTDFLKRVHNTALLFPRLLVFFYSFLHFCSLHHPQLKATHTYTHPHRQRFMQSSMSACTHTVHTYTHTHISANTHAVVPSGWGWLPRTHAFGLFVCFLTQQPRRCSTYSTCWQMDGQSVDEEEELGWSRERWRARGLSLLWQAKTAAVLKLWRSATVLQGGVFVSAYVCVERAGMGATPGRDGEGGKEGARAGTERTTWWFLPGEMLTARWMRWRRSLLRSSFPPIHIPLTLPFVSPPPQHEVQGGQKCDEVRFIAQSGSDLGQFVFTNLSVWFIQLRGPHGWSLVHSVRINLCWRLICCREKHF